MPKTTNSVWRFFASVKLALVTLIILAVTSILGTLIQQGKASAFYVEEYGLKLAGFFELLDFTNMYSSWWFLSLLGLFALNLVVCSIERLPDTWRTVVKDNLAVDPEQLGRMSCTHHVETALSAASAADRVEELLAKAGWRKPLRHAGEDGSILVFAQRGAWTRLGVYVVHLSILVIMAGAIIGSAFGFKAYVFLPEGRSTSNVFLQGSREPMPLGFELHCERFETSYYPNGMVREYRADLAVYTPENKEPFRKSIVVNDPLSFAGITFYQADSFPLEEYFIVISSQASGQEQAFRVPADRDVAWEGTPVTFRIDELRLDQESVVRQAKISFAVDGADQPLLFWMNDNSSVTVGPGGNSYTISFRQLYSTLLLANRDPGVWIVYTGCILMVIGLGICFLLSHRRIWAQISQHTSQCTGIHLGGNSNKNKPALARRFDELITAIRQDTALGSRNKKKKTKA